MRGKSYGFPGLKDGFITLNIFQQGLNIASGIRRWHAGNGICRCGNYKYGVYLNALPTFYFLIIVYYVLFVNLVLFGNTFQSLPFLHGMGSKFLGKHAKTHEQEEYGRRYCFTVYFHYYGFLRLMNNRSIYLKNES